MTRPDENAAVSFPVRSEQLVSPQTGETPREYCRRCWAAELDAAMVQVKDVSAKNAIFAIRNLLNL